MNPCSRCGSEEAERSACPGCNKIFCQACAEAPYEFCCEFYSATPPREPLIVEVPTVLTRIAAQLDAEDDE